MNSWKEKYKMKFILVISLFIAIMLIIITASKYILNYKAFYPGLSIQGENIGGRTFEYAQRQITISINKKMQNEKIKLLFKRNSWTLYLNEIGYGFLIESALNKAYNFGREGNGFKRIREISSLLFKKKDINIETEINYDLLVNKLSLIKKDIDRNSKNSYISFKDNKVNIVPEIIGRKMDIDINAKMIENCILQEEYSSIELIVDEEYPKLLYNEIKDIKIIKSVFNTKYSTDNKNRVSNLQLACKKLTGIIIKPGEIFSMDNALGQRNEENGYKNAPVIVNRQLVEGIGGGVCQVTTTLYNAVLLAGLEVEERTHHSWPLSYVEKGLDATIAEGTIDFKFINNNDYPVAICAEAEKNNLKISLFGKVEDDNIQYTIQSIVLEEYEPEGFEVEIDDKMEDFQKTLIREGKKGYLVAVYRESSKNGIAIKTEKISLDKYCPVKPVYSMNRLTAELFK